MINEDYDNLPTFWDEILENYSHYAPCFWRVKTVELHKNHCFLEKCLHNLVEAGYFMLSLDKKHCRITEKGLRMAIFHDFIDYHSFHGGHKYKFA